MNDHNINQLHDACAPLLGKKIERFETAEILCEDGTWDDWLDLPIRLYCSDQKMISVSWSKFDDLWVSNDMSLPFTTKGSTTRWKSNGIERIVDSIGRLIQGVSLYSEEVSSNDSKSSLWTRLVFDLNGSWLEIYNALDENGCKLHRTRPVGDFRKCT